MNQQARQVLKVLRSLAQVKREEANLAAHRAEFYAQHNANKLAKKY